MRNVPRDPLRQPEATLKSLYRQHTEGTRKVATRRGLWVAVLVYLGFSLTDVLLIPDAAPNTVAARFVISVIMLAALELQISRKTSADVIDRTAALALILAYLCWLVTSLTTTNVGMMSYYMVFVAMFMMSVNLFFSFSFRLAIFSSAVILVLFACGLWVLREPSVGYRLVFALFGISCFVFTSYVNWRSNGERYKVFLNALEAHDQHREAEERGRALLELSLTDSLTGLANRRAMDDRLRELWAEWQEKGEAFAAILIDVDFFKRYNDFYGHLEGDRCLVAISVALQEVATQNSVAIGRFGGEEFVILLKADDQARVEVLCEELRATVETLGLVHEARRDGSSKVTASVGAAVSQLSLKKAEDVLHNSDRALYQAKAGGRNLVSIYNAEDPAFAEDSEDIAIVLKEAVAKNLVWIVYQPIEVINEGQIYALEALMRVKTATGKLVQPNVFIPIAERTGLIVELGAWALRQVCEEIRTRDIAPVVSVNISLSQLRAPGFAAFVALTLSEFGLTASRLALEITESLDVDAHPEVFRCINDLKGLGVQIWLDDFGTGFAGLSWLRLVDFDCIKIDKSFLHDSNTDRGRALLRDIIAMVRQRGARVLVEGVETKEQLELLGALGIDFSQGFHVGRPRALPELQAA